MSFTEGYNRIARVYDKLNSEIDYTAWAKFVNECIERFMDEKPSLVLDLACGTGSMTYKLAELGYDMIGVDGSEDMLSEAYARGTSVGDTNILYLLQDMRSFELYGTVGAVTCCLDSINYLIGDGDMEKCFKTVHNYLEPNGVFIFDMNTPYKHKEVLDGSSYRVKKKGVECVWNNKLQSDNVTVEINLNFTYKTGFLKKETVTETITEKAYTDQEISVMLELAGLKLEAVYGENTYFAPSDNSQRNVYIARKVK